MWANVSFERVFADGYMFCTRQIRQGARKKGGESWNPRLALCAAEPEKPVAGARALPLNLESSFLFICAPSCG